MVSGSYWAVGAGRTVFTAPDQELQLRYGDENMRAQEMGPEQVALPTAQGSAEFWSDRGSVAAPSFRVPAPSLSLQAPPFSSGHRAQYVPLPWPISHCPAVLPSSPGRFASLQPGLWRHQVPQPPSSNPGRKLILPWPP